MSYLIRNTFRTVINLNLCKPNRITVQCLQRNFSDEKTNDSEGVKKPHEKEPSAIDERNTTDAVNPEETKSDGRLGSFAKAFNKYIQPKEEKVTSEPILPFSKLLRESKFIDLGDPQGKIAIGKVFQVVNNDLYIDFGSKFHCVCTRPEKDADQYVRGAKVRIRINELELSTRFLGSEKDLTILEADCQLLGLISSPARTGYSRSKRQIEETQ